MALAAELAPSPEEITTRLKADTSMEVMAHLTCVAQTRTDVHGVLERLATAGIENVIGIARRPSRGQRRNPGPPPMSLLTQPS